MHGHSYYCTKAPKGWNCSRIAGHNGPCAAEPTAWTRIKAAVMKALRGGRV